MLSSGQTDCNEMVTVTNNGTTSQESYAVLQSLLEMTEENTCATASAGFNVDILWGLFSSGAGADAANDCSNFGMVFQETSSAMNSFVCQLTESVRNAQSNSTLTQNLNIKIRSKTGSITASNFNLSQKVDFIYSDEAIISNDTANEWATEMVGAVTQDLQSLMENETEGFGSTLNSESIVWSTVENNATNAQEAVSSVLSELSTVLQVDQNQDLVVEAYGDIVLEDFTLTQEMYIDQQIAQTMAQVLDTTLENLLETESYNTVVSEIRNSMTGFTPGSSTDWWMIIIAVIVLGIIGKGVYSANKKRNEDESQQKSTYTKWLIIGSLLWIAIIVGVILYFVL